MQSFRNEILLVDTLRLRMISNNVGMKENGRHKFAV